MSHSYFHCCIVEEFPADRPLRPTYAITPNVYLPQVSLLLDSLYRVCANHHGKPLRNWSLKVSAPRSRAVYFNELFKFDTTSSSDR